MPFEPMIVCPWPLGFPGDTIGSTLAFIIGFEHGRRQKALAEEISRSPTAKREKVIYNHNKKRNDKRRGSESSDE
jgi:hypothetical protein